MARIRTVKPELWTDPEFTECSLSARLLLIAMLNFASDYGVLPDKPRQLKMQCLPADTIDVEPLLDELVDKSFLVRRVASNGENVLVIRTFSKNQKINRPSKGRWGDPNEWSSPQEDSLKTHGGFSEGSVRPTPRKGRDNSEGKGRDCSEGITPSRRPTGSTGAATNGETTTTELNQRINAVLHELADHQMANASVTPVNTDRYRAQVVNTLLRQHGDRIRTFVTDRPDSPPDTLAQALKGEIS